MRNIRKNVTTLFNYAIRKYNKSYTKEELIDCVYQSTSIPTVGRIKSNLRGPVYSCSMNVTTSVIKKLL